FFRLNVYPIHLPPLRDRVDDIPTLAEHFLRKFGVSNPSGALSADTLAFLKARPWPGNARELRNALEHAAIEARGGPLLPEHFPAPADTGAGTIDDRLRSLVVVLVGERVRIAQARPGRQAGELYQAM